MDVAPVEDDTDPDVLLREAVLARLLVDVLGRTRRPLSSLPAPRLRGDQ